MGAGYSREAYMIPWDELEKEYLAQNLKLTLEEIRSFPEIKREGKDYRVDPKEWERK